MGKELERKNTRSRSVRDFVAVTDRARHCWTTRDASFGAGSRDARPRARLPARAASTPAGSRAARGRTPRNRRRRCVLNRDTSPYTTVAKEPAVRSIVSAPRGAGGRARPLDRANARTRARRVLAVAPGRLARRAGGSRARRAPSARPPSSPRARSFFGFLPRGRKKHASPHAGRPPPQRGASRRSRRVAQLTAHHPPPIRASPPSDSPSRIRPEAREAALPPPPPPPPRALAPKPGCSSS